MPHSTNDNFDKSTIADLVAKYGSSSTTAWLELDRYKIWRPSSDIPESEFLPVQGYMTKDDWIFAWGNPLVSSPAALGPTARAFIQWAEAEGLHPVWACADSDLEQVLGEDLGWSTVSCIYEDYVDPAHVIELTSPEAKGQEGVHAVKDLKKNLMRAEKYDVHVDEVKAGQWKDEERKAVEDGIEAWKASRNGIQIASTTLQPWLDEKHRRYWLARKEGTIVGLLILTPVKSNTWQIKNAVSFPDAPKGTSEALIFTALQDLHHEQNASSGAIPPSNLRLQNGATIPTPSPAPSSATDAEVSSTIVEPPSSDCGSRAISPVSTTGLSAIPTPVRAASPHDRSSPSVLEDENRVALTFGISAAPGIEPVHNLGGWKVKALGKTYSKIASSAKLVNRGEFRRKFDSAHEPMYVCYPPDGFGLDGVNTLFKLLKK